MKASGCRPNIQTYNFLIHALTMRNNFFAAKKLCEVMLEENISPNEVTYSTMIDGLCKNSATSLAIEMLNRIIQHNCLHNLHTEIASRTILYVRYVYDTFFLSC